MGLSRLDIEVWRPREHSEQLIQIWEALETEVMGMDELAQEEHAEEVEGPRWSPEDHHPKGNAVEKKPVKEIKKDWSETQVEDRCVVI